jgi:hypothetical protein
MTAKKYARKATKSKSSQSESTANLNSKKLETRRRIEDLYEEKRLREELDIEVDI